MENYEIIIRLHDPAIEKILKKAVPYSKDVALDVWNEAKVHKRPVRIHDGQLEYMVAPNDILQVRPAGGRLGNKKNVRVGVYHKRLIFSLENKGGAKNRVFELGKTKKLYKGWADSEYEELERVTEETWKSLSREKQDEFKRELEREHKITI